MCAARLSAACAPAVGLVLREDTQREAGRLRSGLPSPTGDTGPGKWRA